MATKTRVLVADDDKGVRELLARVMRSHGFDVKTACDGNEAAAAAAADEFDLIFLDVEMPGRTGMDVLGSIRAGGKNKSVTVFFLTGRDALADRIQGFRMGVDDYLTKPFSIDELLARVDRLLARKSDSEGGQSSTSQTRGSE